MASFPPSAWTSAPTHLSSPFPTFRTRTLHTFKPSRASPADQSPQEEQPVADPVKLAFLKATAYKKDKKPTPVVESKLPPSTNGGADALGDDSSQEIPAAVKLAKERAKEYKKNKVATGMDSGQELNLPKSSTGTAEKNTIKKGNLKVSTMDFVGLDFAEKKSYRGRPPGLAPVVEPLVEGDLPEVELIVGDPSKFGDANPSVSVNQENNEENMTLYKPKVSTWGVFPRPDNISKTFGGGRNIKPGEVLATAEDKAAKEKRSRELIAAYKSKMGLTIDAKTKAECEKAMKEGDRLMDLGRLREALPFYEKIMKDLVFQSELHGQAALQWSICQDSLGRPNEARSMYENLQSHPNVQVSKRARQFAFSFQAMEMMKVSSSSFSRQTGYEDYFDAFVENKDDYTAAEEVQEESMVTQGLPYILFLASPILFVVFLAARKSSAF